MSVPAVAIVLAGGEGSRMGGGKPLRRVGGSRLIDRALTMARAYSAHVAVSVRDQAQVGPLDSPLVLDAPDLGGPIAGLKAALAYGRSLGAGRLLTLPCDMPLLPADLGGRLEEVLQEPSRVSMVRHDGRLHPVCAIWSLTAEPLLDVYVATGGRSLRGFAEQVGCVELDLSHLPAASFFNANTPQDLAEIEVLLDPPPLRPAA